MIDLRPVAAPDEDRLLAWRNTPEVAANMYRDHRISSDEHRTWFHGLLEDPARLGWIIRNEGEDIGLATVYGMEPVDRRCAWAFYIGEAGARGRGIGSAVEYLVLEHAFGALGMRKVSCEVLARNVAVWTLHLRLGFRQEGLLRRHVWKSDGPHDVLLLAMLREEWQERRGSLRARLLERGLIAR